MFYIFNFQLIMFVRSAIILAIFAFLIIESTQAKAANYAGNYVAGNYKK